MKNYWIGFIKQRGVFDFFYLCLRKFISFFVKSRFAKCNNLMLCGTYQIKGYKSITIGKLSAGERFRMEAISVAFNQNFIPEIIIGNNVSVGSNVHIGCISKLIIGDDVLCGSNIVILDHDHGYYSGLQNKHSAPNEPPSSRRLNSGPIVIGNNVHIGDCVIILKNVLIGSGVVIGAGAVVTKSIPNNSLAVGNPAKVIKQYDCLTKQWINVFGKLD